MKQHETGSLQTSMFLQATFFTTAGKRSDAFLPRAIICREHAHQEAKESTMRNSQGDIFEEFQSFVREGATFSF